MQQAIEAFRESASRAEHPGGRYKALSGLTTAAVDASDLLRAQVVLAVSALDFYVHEITVRGMVEVFEGRKRQTEAFLKYRVSVGSVALGMSTQSSSWFESEVRERHSYLSFQQPDKVADAIRLFSDAILWREVALLMATSERNVKDQLKLIIDRRNKIAHEADLDPSYPHTRWPIKSSDVEQSVHFPRSLCESIHTIVV